MMRTFSGFFSAETLPLPFPLTFLVSEVLIAIVEKLKMAVFLESMPEVTWKDDGRCGMVLVWVVHGLALTSGCLSVF